MATNHDSLVKILFTNIDDAASALASALPEAVAKRIDWSSLKHANLSLIDPKLRAFYSDVVFTANVDGREIFLYVSDRHRSQGTGCAPTSLRVYFHHVRRRS